MMYDVFLNFCTYIYFFTFYRKSEVNKTKLNFSIFHFLKKSISSWYLENRKTERKLKKNEWLALLNRFCVHCAAVGHPPTIYGKGGQVCLMSLLYRCAKYRTAHFIHAESGTIFINSSLFFFNVYGWNCYCAINTWNAYANCDVVHLRVTRHYGITMPCSSYLWKINLLNDKAGYLKI
jgi:hypothetical protein